MNMNYQDVPVEILDVTTDGAGVQWASVKALQGEPFTGGNRFPVKTAYAIVKLDDLAWECGCVLPEQSCSACRSMARLVYGGEDEFPF